MSTPIAVEVNCETKVVTERPLTPEEIAQREADAAAAALAEAEREAEEAAKAATRQSAIDKLAALGLTPEEAAAIVGG
jgi:pyruvate/oxaloacetate carboxyltransferase